MSTATRMERSAAIAIAKAFVAEIEPYTDQLIVAGSLRRRLAYIGDIEIVAVPKIEMMSGTQQDLFGATYYQYDVDRLDERMSALLEAGAVTKRLDANGSPRWGQTLRYATYQGARVDLFTPCAERFGLILAIRTGPWQLSRWFVTKKSQRGALPDHLVVRDGWVHYRTSGERIPTPDEESFFSLLGIPFIPAWERDDFARRMVGRRAR